MDGHGDFPIGMDHFTPAKVHEARLAAEELEAARVKLKPIIDAFNNGAATVKEVAAVLNKPVIAVLARFTEAKRRKLIGDYPLQSYEQNRSSVQEGQ